MLNDLCKCVLADDGPVRAETCSSSCILKRYCTSNEVYPFVGLYYDS
jgi:hypothetical protein